MLAAIFAVTEHVSPRYLLTLLSDLLMLDTLRFGWRIASPTWSLYPEVLFSVLLPLWVLFTGRSWRSAVVAYVALAVFSWAALPTGPTDAGFNLLRYFFLGMVLEHFVRHMRRDEPMPLLANLALYISFVLGCFASVAFSVWSKAVADETTLAVIVTLYRRIGLSFHQDLSIVLLVPPILLCQPLRQLFSSPLPVFLGLISYGTYLLHIPLMFLFNGTGFSAAKGTPEFDLSAPAAALGQAGLPVYWLAVICVATLCHFVIERPMIRWGYVLARRHQ